MHRTSIAVVLLLSTLLSVSSTSAQEQATTSVPNLIRYGGTLKDASGAPIASATGVAFAIYKQQDGGAPVWMETQNVSTDAGGNYSVLLGSTTATRLPSDIFSQEEQRWLGVQAQGQAEQPRVLLVGVPYAMKAVEADRLAGHSASEFVTADNLQKAVQQQLQRQTSGVVQAAPATANHKSVKAGQVAVLTDPATNFVDNTTDQVVGVTQNGSGKALYASAGRASAIVGISGADAGLYGISTATTGQTAGIKASSSSPTGYGLVAFETASTGAGSSYGVYGTAASTLGVGIRGTATAMSGSTVGISASVASPAGIAGVFNNVAGGKILSGQNNGAEKFSVDGSGNVNALGGFTGSGGGLTGIQFSQLSGALAGSQFSGTYGNAVTLSSTSNVFYGNGSNLTGVVAEPGSPYYVQNGTSQQASANFNISGTGSANSFSAATTYQIGGRSVLSIGSAVDANLFLGVGAGASNLAGQGVDNTFSGSHAGYNNTSGSANTFSGYYAGYGNTSGTFNTFYGWRAGYFNTTGQLNTFYGTDAGYRNTTGSANTFYGQDAGWNTSSGNNNTISGSGAGNQNTTGNDNTIYGFVAGYSNTIGHDNSFYGYGAGTNNTTGNSNVYIANPGPPSGNESNTIRIGQQGSGNLEQNTAYIAGIYGATSAGGIPVYINSSGQLGTMTSSLRFKEQVHNMGDSTNGLMKLRPVTFFYKPEYDKGPRTLQYGLIAEEVADIYPDLVAYDDDGQPYTVRYQYITTMLLNEVQKQYHRAEKQSEVIATQQREIDSLKQQLQLQNATLQQRLSRLERMIDGQVSTVAQAQ